MTSRTKRIIFIPLVLIAAIVILALLYVRHVNERARFFGPGGTARCGIHLKQIGLAMLLHAKDHGGRYPARLEDLVLAAPMDSLTLICPWTTDTPAANHAELDNPGHNSFVFLASRRLGSEIGNDEIVAHEPLTNHEGDGAMALFGDGHVEWLAPEALSELLARAKSPATTRATSSEADLAR